MVGWHTHFQIWKKKKFYSVHFLCSSIFPHSLTRYRDSEVVVFKINKWPERQLNAGCNSPVLNVMAFYRQVEFQQASNVPQWKSNWRQHIAGPSIPSSWFVFSSELELCWQLNSTSFYCSCISIEQGSGNHWAAVVHFSVLLLLFFFPFTYI